MFLTLICLFVATFVPSKRGNKGIQLNGYRFTKHRTIGLKVRWYCSTHHSRGCSAVIYTVDDVIVKINPNHTH